MTPVALAARNNAEWCDAVTRSWGGRGQFGPELWINPGEAPPFYPNAVTLAQDEARQVAAIKGAVDAAPDHPFSVKDSFQALDLTPLGFEPLFDAAWIWREPAPLPRANTWIARDAEGLASWEAAWGDREGETRLFRPALLEEPDHAFIAAEAGGRIAAGCVASRSAEVVGVSNLFGPADLQAGCIAAAMDWGPGRPVVGYEAGATLDALKSLGFQALGPLRVWIRAAR